MAAVPFGFSAGDFVAGLGLINKAARALRSTSGATSSYQQAILDLDLVERVLRQVQGLSPVTSNVETIRAVQLCSLTCHVPLDRFWRKIKKLEPYMTFVEISSQSLQERLVAGTRKLQWAITLEEDVKVLKSSISTGLGTINTLLQLELLERGAVAHEDATQTLQLAQRSMPVLERIESTLNDHVDTRKRFDSVVTTLSSVQQQLPSMVAALVVDRLANLPNSVPANQSMTATKVQSDTIISLLKNMLSRQNGENLVSQTRDQDIVELRHFAVESQRMLLSLSEKASSASALTRSPFPGTSTWKLEDRACSHDQSVNSRAHTVGDVLYESVKAVLSIFLLVGPMIHSYVQPLGAIIRNPRFFADTKIHFVDALDREFVLDYEHFCHWPVLLALLQVRFRGLPGKELVANNQFALLAQSERAGKGTLIPAQQWNRSIFPGCRVVMSMLVDQQPHNLETCVSCGSDTWFEYGAPLRLLCARCGKNYRTLHGSRLSTHFIITPFSKDTPGLLKLNEEVFMVCDSSLEMRRSNPALKNAFDSERFSNRSVDEDEDAVGFQNARRQCCIPRLDSLSPRLADSFAYGRSSWAAKQDVLRRRRNPWEAEDTDLTQLS